MIVQRFTWEREQSRVDLGLALTVKCKHPGQPTIVVG